MAEQPILQNIPRMTIRVGYGTLSFSIPAKDKEAILYEPYVVKSGMSMSANLREAFKSMDFLNQVPPKVRLVVDERVLMVPVSHYDEQDARLMYDHAFPNNGQTAGDSRQQGSNVLFCNVLPELNAVAVSVVNKDLKLVVADHFDDITLLPAMVPVWNQLYRRSFTGSRQKLYAYFHERQLDVFSYQQKGFRFCNSFEVRHIRDAVFFLLSVWKSLQLSQTDDELHLVGDIFRNDAVTTAEREDLMGELRKFLRKVYVINPLADFMAARAATGAPDSAALPAGLELMPYDLQALYMRRG